MATAATAELAYAKETLRQVRALAADAHVLAAGGVHLTTDSAREIDDQCADAMQNLARIIEAARIAQHQRIRKGTLLRKVRRLLGFAYPEAL